MPNRKRRAKKSSQSPAFSREDKKHPADDLNAHHREGQKIDRFATSQEPGTRTAADIKELTATLAEFTSDELRQIPVVPIGIALKEGAVYLDLQNRAFGPFVAPRGAAAEEHHLYVPKAEVPHELWNRLVPKRSPEQAREEEEGHSKDETMPESMIDKTLADSFPTSDPPSWTTGREKE